MNNIIDAHGESQRKKWKLTTKDDSSILCTTCTDPGGVFIRCSNEKCAKYCHLDCAFQSGSLLLADDGLVTFECDTHFRDIIFCTCKKKYDVSQEMVFCDECCDWFHVKCERLNNDSVQKMEKYTCLSCKDTKKQGKAISKQLKEKNLEKEARSMYNQSAIHIFTIMVEIADSICPVIDRINRWDEDVIIIKDLEEILQYLSSPPFVLSRNGETSEQMENDNRFLTQFGALDLAKKWMLEINRYLGQTNNWIDAIGKFVGDVVVSFDTNQASESKEITWKALFSRPQIDKVQECFQTFRNIESSKPNNLADFGNIIYLDDALKWMMEFIQVRLFPRAFILFPFNF